MIFDQNSVLQAACDTSIARVTECVDHVYPREGCRSVTPLLMPGSTTLLRRSALFCARKLTVQPALLRGTNQTFFVESSMHMIQQIIVIAISVSKLSKGDTWVYRVDTHVPVYSLYRLCGRPAEIQPRPDARIVSAVESS